MRTAPSITGRWPNANRRRGALPARGGRSRDTGVLAAADITPIRNLAATCDVESRANRPAYPVRLTSGPGATLHAPLRITARRRMAPHGDLPRQTATGDARDTTAGGCRGWRRPPSVGRIDPCSAGPCSVGRVVSLKTSPTHVPHVPSHGNSPTRVPSHHSSPPPCRHTGMAARRRPCATGAERAAPMGFARISGPATRP